MDAVVLNVVLVGVLIDLKLNVSLVHVAMIFFILNFVHVVLMLL